MTLDELRVNDTYEMTTGDRYRLPIALLKSSDKKIRAHLIYANTLFVLKTDDELRKEYLGLYSYFFNFTELDKVSIEDSSIIDVGGYFTARVPNKELDDYKEINRAIKDYKKSKESFSNLKQVYEDFARVIYGYMSIESFCSAYIKDTLICDDYNELSSKETVSMFKKYIDFFKKQKIKIELVKFISDSGKPTYGNINVEGEEEESVIIMLQEKNEIGLLINVFPHKHYVFCFSLQKNIIRKVKVIDPVMSNYYNYNSINIKFDASKIFKDN